MEYNFRDIEKKWQEWWTENKIYKVSNDSPKPKYYVLDMFPYPSGAGLHVGHPLGYIASDIYARFKRLKGYNVLHPMGYDAFGLPAEQYAIDHGIHPAVSTEANIKNFRSQLDKIGFCFDWDREVNTSKPEFYKWTQWIFLQLFNSYFCHTEKKALPISLLIKKYEKKGAIPKTGEPVPGKHFTADQWKAFSEKEKADVLMRRRLAYCGYGEVNWCEALGTVLANDEVINGVSERGGYPVVKKTLRQWYLRITEYADRLLEGLDKVDFSDAMKEMQTNWIGKSSGAEIDFKVTSSKNIESLTPNPSPGGEGNAGDSATSGKFFKTADKKNWGILKDLSRENRKNKTEAEDILWQELRNNQLGYKVRRQHVIDGFIIDFAFLQQRLLIEVDGGYHADEEQKRYDDARTEYLSANGFKVLKFTNEQVINNKDEVIKQISEELKHQSTEGSNTPLSDRRGDGGEALKLRVYTTRPDTIFGVDFMVIAPEHELVEKITRNEQKQAVDDYITYVKSRSERERMAEKKITGVFTGAYAINPFNGREIPIWISEYVLAGYGTGAIMAVPCGDQRDFLFAKHFNIPITNIIGVHFNGEEANPTKDAVLENSDFLNDLVMINAIDVVLDKIETMGIGVRKVNYKMRDAAFSRQRYWGEPFPIVWKEGIAYALDESELPVELPHMDDLKPGPDAQGPLANLPEWTNYKGGTREVNTMPGYAGSSWYFLRYMDPHNDKEFCDRKVSDYWNQVDLYIGGTEHAVGHLLYSRMWTKFLFDLNLIGHDEPYKRLVNQGMIQGSSRFVYRFIKTNTFYSKNIFKDINDNPEKPENKKILEENRYTEEDKTVFNYRDTLYQDLHVDVNIVDGVELDIEEFKRSKPQFKHSKFILEDGKYICGVEIEKMSKSKFNTVNPDDLVIKYGADTFRMYEMFLGPVEMSKPWDTKGIEGVHRFLKKLWRLFYADTPLSDRRGVGGEAVWTEEKATEAELKVLHRTIKKIEEDTERFSFNTGVSAFMIAVNDLTDLKCYKKEILEPLLILLAPYAPHITEELYHQLNSSQVSPLRGDLEGASILNAVYPKLEGKYLVENSKEYPISINGKMRTTIDIALGIPESEVEKIVLANSVVQKWLEGKPPKKIIYKEGKMVNVVV
jgi:leucyl-tRNA synthetase